MSQVRQPTIYLSHGGGPCFWIEPPASFGKNAFEKLRVYLASLLDTLPERPRAFLVISAHWEEHQPTVGIGTQPSMFFDYYGFPEHTYRLNYPAPGAPDVAQQVRSLLQSNNIDCATNATRGYDHGVFVPFLIVDPEGDIPVVPLSLKHNLDPAQHIEIGEALEPLRDDGILIVGSGMSYHNLRQFRDGDDRASAEFDQWLVDAVTQPNPEERSQQLVNWSQAPYARACQPREDHLLPLMVAAGAGGDDIGVHSFRDVMGGKAFSCFTFGDIRS